MANPPKKRQPTPQSLRHRELKPARDRFGRVLHDYVSIRIRGTIMSVRHSFARESGRKYMILTVATVSRHEGVFHRVIHEVWLFGRCAEANWQHLSESQRIELQGRTAHRKSHEKGGRRSDRYCVVAYKVKWLGVAAKKPGRLKKR